MGIYDPPFKEATPAQRRDIVRRFANGESVGEIARSYGPEDWRFEMVKFALRDWAREVLKKQGGWEE